MRLVVVSNRGPVKRGEDGSFVRSTGGLATALDPLLARRGGTWIWQEDSELGAEAVRATALTDYECGFAEVPHEARAGFYEGFSNGVLWPLMHSFPPTTAIGAAPWSDYAVANEAFASAALGAGTDAVFWVHDYQLALVPGMIRARRPGAAVGWFCHIPWPSADLFEILPWRVELARGVLGADVVGFHTARYADNFLDGVARVTDAVVDRRRRLVSYDGRTVRVVVAPIGIDVAGFKREAAEARCLARARELREAVGGRRIVLGVDRLDYTKGIVERLHGYRRWLASRPGIDEEVVFVQIVVPSRTGVPAYAALKEEVDRVVGEINGRHGALGRVAVQYLYRAVSREELVAHYRAADVALVTPLRDGMNLVAHEYVASRPDGDGVLVLSELAGAAQHLDGAVLVNPYDPRDVAAAIGVSLFMPLHEQARRMASLRASVEELDVHGWAERFLTAVCEDGARRETPGSGAAAAE